MRQTSEHSKICSAAKFSQALPSMHTGLKVPQHSDEISSTSNGGSTGNRLCGPLVPEMCLWLSIDTGAEGCYDSGHIITMIGLLSPMLPQNRARLLGIGMVQYWSGFTSPLIHREAVYKS